MKRNTAKNLALLALAALVFGIALVLGTRAGGEFGGTDAAATQEIEKSDHAYVPWFKPLWTQPGGEVESGLFAMQAALGAGVVGFVLGTFRERHRHTRAASAASTTADEPPAQQDER